jgi:nicotinic acid mononucleotide adenylyltransferase
MKSRFALAGGSRVVLLVCGSFNPPTILHLRMFERARDFLQQVLLGKKSHGMEFMVWDKCDY